MKAKEAEEIETQALRVFELLEDRKIERVNTRTKRVAMLLIIGTLVRFLFGMIMSAQMMSTIKSNDNKISTLAQLLAN